MPEFPPGVHLKGGQTAAVTHARMAREFYAPIIPVVLELRRQGLSLRAIARELDQRGIRMRQEAEELEYCRKFQIRQKPMRRPWNASQVRRILARAAREGIGPSPGDSVRTTGH
ncbi:MAG: recombinase family protein [Planctomycetes bacterium]|nr:recombinase family protein [Planctomycetota bacterium]